MMARRQAGARSSSQSRTTCSMRSGLASYASRLSVSISRSPWIPPRAPLLAVEVQYREQPSSRGFFLDGALRECVGGLVELSVEQERDQ